MYPDRVIVTIETQNGQICGDYELPAKVPIRRFLPILLNLISRLNPQFKNLAQAGKVGIFQKKQKDFVRIPDEDELYRHAIRDGSILMIAPMKN